MKRRVSARQLEKRQLAVVQPDNEKGAFAPLPNEVCITTFVYYNL